LALALVARTAVAEPSPGVRLVYFDRSDANCPAEPDLRAAAAARLGYDPFAPTGKSSVVVTITRTARGLRGEIRVEDPSREGAASRSIESSSGDCAELGKAMALAISIAVDAMSLSSPMPQEPRPPSASRDRPATNGPRAARPNGATDEHLVPPAAEPELQGVGSIASDIPRRSSGASAEPPDTARWYLAVHGLTSVGFAPGVTAGGALGAGWLGQGRSFEIEGRADYPQSTPHGTGSIRVWPLLVTVAPCVNARGWAFCGLGRLGRLHGSGHGFAVDRTGSSVVATVGFRLANEAILSKPLRFRVFFDLDWIPTNNSFDVDGRSAWATSTWAVSLGLGLTTRFP